MLVLEAFMIYDLKGLIKQLLNHEIDLEKAVRKVQSLFVRKGSAVRSAGFTVLPPVFLLHWSDYGLRYSMRRLRLYVWFY